MDKDSPRYGSRDDEDSRLFTDEPPERTESRQSDGYGSRLFDDEDDAPPSASDRRGGLYSPDRGSSKLPRYDADASGDDRPRDSFTTSSSREGSGFRSGAGFGRGLERDAAGSSEPSWPGDDTTGRNPLLPDDGAGRSERRFSWEKDEPSDPAPQAEPGRDYTAERAGIVSSRLDRLSSGMRQRLSERSYETDRDAQGSSYAEAPPVQDYDPAPRPAYDPPPRDERVYRDEPQVEDSYIPPEEPAQYQGYDDAPYRGAHARELADVDERYAREYQYDAEETDGRQADYRDFDDEDYQQFEQPYGDYQPKSKAPFLIVGSLIGVAVIGAGLFYIYQQGVGETTGGDIPVVVIDDAPIKVKPDNTGTANISSKTKLIYDRIIGEETQTEGTLVPREETPIAVTPNDQSQNSDAVTPGASEVTPEPSKVVNDQIIPQAPDSTAATDNGGDALPLPLPPPPAGNDTAQLNPTPQAPNPVPAAGTNEALNTGGNIVVPPANEPPAPATQERSVALVQPTPEQPALTTAPALTTTQEAPAVTPAVPAAVSPLTSAPPLPKEKPVPPSRQAAPGPAVPTGPIQIAPLPGSTERAVATPQVPAAAPAAPAQAQATTRRRSASRFSEEIAAPGTAFTSTQDTQIATAPVQQQPQVLAPAPAPAPVQQQAPVSDGRYLIQLASFRSQQEAQAEFDKLKQRHPSLIGEYASLIQQADLGTRGVYYRLRIGPIDSKQGASKLCNSLIAAGEKDCLVRQR